MLFFQQKYVTFVFFISRSRSLSPFFLLSSAGLPPTFVFLCLSFALYSKCVDMTINLSFRQHGYRNNFRFPFSYLLTLLVVSASQVAGGYAISHQNNLELHLGCHTGWLSYFTLVCLWCGRTVVCSGGRCTVTWLPRDGYIYLPIVLRWRALRARESSAIKGPLE